MESLAYQEDQPVDQLDKSECYILDACDELMLHAILCKLDSEIDLANVMCVCKRLRTSCQDNNALWANLCYKRFGLKLQVSQTAAC